MRRYEGSLWGLGSAHQVAIDLPNADKFLSQPPHTLSTTPVKHHINSHIFGWPLSGAQGGHSALEDLERKLDAPVERMMLNEASALATIERGRVHTKAASLVTFATRVEDMEPWERSANVRIVDAGEGERPDTVEVDFHRLLRNFGGCIATDLAFGRDLLQRCPGLLDDLWQFDRDLFPFLMLGLPTWTPLKMMRDGLAARSRLVDAFTALYRRVSQYQNGDAVDFGADMSDVGAFTLERNRVYDENGFSFEYRGYEYGVLWALNANTQPLVFWMLTFVYSTPGLLAELRREVAPYVDIAAAAAEDPGRKPTLGAMDYRGVTRDCPLLRAAMLETFRLANEATSIRCVARPVRVADGARETLLPPGTFVSVAHAATQYCPDVYPDPHRFDPARFLETDPADPGRRVARYGKLRPWGGGPGMCKGRAFAEKEMLSVAAAVISLWDVNPAGPAWEIPAMLPGTGSKQPAKEMRVRLKRRKFD